MKTQIVIGVCTRQRPDQLRRLLSSLQISFEHAKQTIPILIVENDCVSSNQDLVAEFPLLDIKCFLEPKIGLCHARNRLFDEAELCQSDWFIGLDDDEWVAEDWFEEFLRALAKCGDATLLMGPCKYLYGPDLSPYLSPDQFQEMLFGDEPFVMTTQNYAVHMSLIDRKRGKEMRFHPAFNETGGEDLEFFLRAVRLHSARAIWVPDAIVNEERKENRATLAYRLDRTRRNLLSALRIDHLHWREHGIGNPVRNGLGLLALTNRNVVYGLVGLVVGSIWSVFSLEGKQQVGRALRRLSRVQAAVQFCFGRKPIAYGADVKPS